VFHVFSMRLCQNSFLKMHVIFLLHLFDMFCVSYINLFIMNHLQPELLYFSYQYISFPYSSYFLNLKLYLGALEVFLSKWSTLYCKRWYGECPLLFFDVLFVVVVCFVLMSKCLIQLNYKRIEEISIHYHVPFIPWLYTWRKTIGM